MRICQITAFLFLLSLAACGDESKKATTQSPIAEEPPPTMTNRIDCPSAVRRNLGITFATVEMRRVKSTIRVPGSFEILRDAHSAYSSTLSGHVQLLVKEHENVEKFTPLFRVRSPEWRKVQKELAQTVVAIRQAKAKLDALIPRQKAAALHAKSLEEEQQVWKDRLEQIANLRAAGGGVATAETEARAQLGSLQTSLAEAANASADIESEHLNKVSELAGYRETSPILFAEALGPQPVNGSDGSGVPVDLSLARAAALLGVPVAHLRENVGTAKRPIPRWRTIEHLEVRAQQAGHVEHLGVSNGAWVEVGTPVMETVDPTQLRFRASALQADLGRLKDGMAVQVVAPDSCPESSVPGTLRIALEADPLTRKIDLLVKLPPKDLPYWARNGVASEVEIQTAGTDEPTLAVPQRSVILDGLERVLFRRDPKDSDKVIRVTADLGPSDGRWIAVESGLVEGDEVVLDGVYELMLASGASVKQEGGHFHADGTWHPEEH